MGGVGRVATGVATGGMSELARGASGGKGGKNGGPSAPDFMAAAREQAKSSRNDVRGTFGGARWGQGPDGRWTLNMDMAPELQAASGKLMSGLASSTWDPAAERDKAIDAAYRMQTSRLDPQFEQMRAARSAELANQGYSVGDAGYRAAMDTFNRGQNDAYQQALLGAQSGAGQTAYGQALAGAMMPYTQLQAIQGIGERPGYASLGQAQPQQDLAAAMQAYQGALQKYGIQQQSKNSMMGGLGNLGVAALMAG